jgi:3'(2'), 5'-bisphosphate nucleotidase
MIQHVPHIIRLLEEAGRRIMVVYDGGAEAANVQWKEDDSPLTLADKQSHDYLIDELSALNLQIPIMSEESVQLPFSERNTWSQYWCLDPKPVLGFIHVPVSGHTFWAALGKGAHHYDGVGTTRIQSNRKSREWIAIGSGSHGTEEELAVLGSYPVVETRKAGSALKFCLIAQGKADIYYRHGPTMEWDTAAGHILVREAGAMFEFIGGSERNYNKESLLNPSFLVRIQHP